MSEAYLNISKTLVNYIALDVWVGFECVSDVMKFVET